MMPTMLLSGSPQLRVRSPSVSSLQRMNRPATLTVKSYLDESSKVGARPAAPKAANQLEALRQMSKVVADTGELAEIAKYKPEDATTNPSLVYKAVQLPAYSHFIQDSVAAEGPGASLTDIADRLSVDIGCEVLRLVPGRVSTEIDARLSYNTQATIDRALGIVDRYAQAGHDPSRIYIKIASTWEGTRACEQLQKQGIDCNMTLLFSFAQAAACADAGAALISPFVGRIMDWYKKRNQKEYSPEEDPGVLSVKTIYAYFKRFNYGTTIMAASFRNVGEIQALAGCDAITIAPALLKELEANTEPLKYALWPGMAGSTGERLHLGAGAQHVFEQLHGADPMAVDKLEEGIAGFSADIVKLEAMLSKVLGK